MQQDTASSLTISRSRFQLMADALAALNEAFSQEEILDNVRRYAGHLVGAEAVSVVLRDREVCSYVTEDAPQGLLMGVESFPALAPLSELAVRHQQVVIVPDVHHDERIPPSTYEGTCARSLIVIPVDLDGVYAFGVYWFGLHLPTNEEVAILETLARAAGAAYQRKDIEDHLRTSEISYRSIAELSQDGILIDQGGRFVYANPAALKLLRAENIDQIVGRAPLEFILPQDQEQTHFRIARCQAGLTDPLAEIGWRRLDATLFEAEVTAAPVIWKDRPAVQLFIRDITERKQIQDALCESEERFRALVQAIAQAVWETNAVGEVIADLPSWRHYTGQSLQESMKNGWSDAVHPDDREYAQQRWRDAVASIEPINMEFRLYCVGQGWRWTNVLAAPLKNADGTVRKWVGMNMDITARKLAEESLRKSEEFHRITAEAGQVGTWNMDMLETQECVMSPIMVKMLGLETTRTSFSLTEWLDAILPDDRASVNGLLAGLSAGVDTVEFPFRVLWKDGTVHYLLGRGKASHDEKGKPTRLFGATIDVTLQRRIEEEFSIANQQLNIANERLQLAVISTGDGFWDWDLRSNISYVSTRYKEILGYADHEMPDQNPGWHLRIFPEDERQVHAAYDDCINGLADSFHAEFRVGCKDGQWKWVLSRGVLLGRDKQRKPERLIGMLTDISERKQIHDRIWRHANFDALTQLPNRRLFRDRLEQEVRIAQRRAEKIALMFIDLDRFKQVNDLLGHDAGDALLIQAARRIEACVRSADTVARLGGDEFTVILTGLNDIGIVEQIAQKILNGLVLPFQIGKDTVHVSGSIGLMLYPDDATTPEDMIRKADQAMYAAKRSGKNQFSYFTDTMDQSAHHRLRLINELHNALEEGQLSVAYQPVVDLVSNMVVKAEALVRWHHPAFGNIAPSDFIPLAEESGVINEIGDWVFREAARCAKQWSSKIGKPFQIGVNKSPVQFMSKHQDSWIDYLERLDLPPKYIVVEITEGLLLHASGNVSDRLFEYRDAGIQVALDDFGTGYSSMAYLKKFDIDYLKIDQSFVKDIAIDIQNRTIAESIIVMAHKLGLKVIAEGVETSEQRDILAAAGCDYGQGYLFAKPMEASDFERSFIGTQLAYSQVH